jgi:septal ring factor EnvC (AmiA/AmiB activator)
MAKSKTKSVRKAPSMNKKIEDKLNELAMAESHNSKDISYIKEDISEIKTDNAEIKKSISDIATKLEEKMETHYVSNDKFLPVKYLAFGAAGAILASVVGAWMAIVIPKVTMETKSQYVIERVNPNVNDVK